MLHFELIHLRLQVRAWFSDMTLGLGHLNRATAQPGCILLVTPRSQRCYLKRRQLKREGGIVGIRRAIFLRLGPPWAVSSLMPSTSFGTTCDGGPKRQVGQVI